MAQKISNQDELPFSALTRINIDNPYISARFKIWVVGIIFSLVCFHLFVICVFPDHVILPKELILGIVLALVSYLWGQEVRDRDYLRSLNEHLIQAQGKLQAAEVATMAALVQAEEAKDVMVKGHSERVAKFTLALAEAKEFSSDTKEMIRRAAILHDLGKLAIPDHVLNKPGKLNDEEWAMIRRHPQIAVDILEPLKFLFLEKEIILHHHERLDGGGYPSGLKGAAIPIEARMVAVADTFDAMNSSRIYRATCSREQIVTEMRRVSGTQLDGSLVELFFKILEQRPDFWERN